MAAPIDQLLKSAKTLNADQLILEPDRCAIVVINHVARELTKTPLASPYIFKLLSPIMPEEHSTLLINQPSTQFKYTLEDGSEFLTKVIKEHNSVRVFFKNLALSGGAHHPPVAHANPMADLNTTQPLSTRTVPPPPSISAGAKPPMAQASPGAPPMAQASPGGPPQANLAQTQNISTARHTAPMVMPSGQPVPTAQPISAQPMMAQPISAQPISAQPISAQPVPTAQPMMAQPISAQPATPMARPGVPMAQPISAQPISAQAVPPTTNLPPTTALPVDLTPLPTVPLDEHTGRPAIGKPVTDTAKAQPYVPIAAQPMYMPTTTGSMPMNRTQNSSLGQTTERPRLRTELDRLLERTLKMKGSDLHLATSSPPIVRRFGSLIRLEGDPTVLEKAQAMIKEILTDEQHSRFEKTGDLDFSYEVIGGGRFRGNILRQNRGIDLTFHVVPSEIQSPEALGLPPLVRELTRNHQGLILITGAAGQGKSTTISCLVNIINSERPLHIITVEDPIEFVHPVDKRAVVNQREVGRHTKSFANALRAALREDPDVIVVGEMRDLETISLAITAAETGHLVMGTLMTSSAHQTVDRILESFPSGQQNQIRAMLSESLRAVVSQRLLPLADGTGMVLAVEMLLGTVAVANLIREKKTFQIPSILQTNRHLGMKRLDDSIIELVLSGKISQQKGLEYISDKKSFESAISKRN